MLVCTKQFDCLTGGAACVITVLNERVYISQQAINVQIDFTLGACRFLARYRLTQVELVDILARVVRWRCELRRSSC